jgi:hypothetical protein
VAGCCYLLQGATHWVLAMGFRRSGKFATGYAIVNDLVGFKNKALFFREVS